jgi:hypothetical protein
MKTITINGQEYEIEITLGTLEDLEERGWELGKIAEAGVSVKLALDIAELTLGIERKILRKLPPSSLASLVEAVSEGLSGDDDGEGGEPGR